MDISSLILWQDEALLAVNKPAGLLTIRDGYDPTLPYLHLLLNEAYGPVWVIHRLDKDTSGLVLFARSANSHRSLSLQFEHRETQKEYHALCAGIPDWQQRTITLPLKVNGDRRHRTIIDELRGRPAATDCRLQRVSSHWEVALISASPYTGYTHQIRAHLASLGFPILADPLYRSLIVKPPASLPSPLPIERTALHARQITFTHPLTRERITLTAPYPADFQSALNALM